ncbi:MAG: chromosome condensation protein CrcB, partial [Corynebacterium sp.]
LKTHNYRLFAGYLTATIIGGLAALQLGLTIGTMMT